MQPIRQEEQENEKEYANNLYTKEILPRSKINFINSYEFTEDNITFQDNYCKKLLKIF